MTDTRREFMTSWHSSSRPPIEAWSVRDRATFMETGTSTHRVPPFRAFDLLAQPNERRVLLENADHRIGVESVCGAAEMFRRHIDFDTVYFQYAGTTALETEFGELTMNPGDVAFIPGGIAHRSTGTADSLRWFAYVVAPFFHFMSSDDQTSETKFVVTRKNGPDWTIPAGAEQPRQGRARQRADDLLGRHAVGSHDHRARVPCARRRVEHAIPRQGQRDSLAARLRYVQGRRRLER